MNMEGQPLESIRIARRLSLVAFEVGTDGESHLVIWSDGALHSTTIDRDGGVITRDLNLGRFYPSGLAWNGSFYLATSFTGDMVLLDRQGSIASGVLTVSIPEQQIESRYLGVVSNGTRWLVAGGLPRRRGLVDAADFPPVGESKAFDLPLAPSTAIAQFAAFLGGYVSVEVPPYFGTNELVVQLYDSSGQPSGELRRFTRPGLVLGNIRLAVRNRSLYVAYQTCLAPCQVTDIVELHFEPIVSERRRDPESGPKTGHSVEITLLGTFSAHYSTLVMTDRGLLSLSWGGREGKEQIHSALVGSEAFRTGGTSLSVDLPRQRSPRIASGVGGHLVAWVEDGIDDYGQWIRFGILGHDGRPAGKTGTVPVTLPGEWGGAPLVASDGANYLLAWSSRTGFSWQMHGTIVSRDGQILRPPFILDPRPVSSQSIVWNGVAYALALSNQDVVFVGSDGTILEPNPAKVEDFPTRREGLPGSISLARDGDTLLVLGREYFCPPFDAAACGVSYETAVRRADLTRKALDSEADQAWNGRWMCCGLTYFSPQPAVAAGGGHRLVVWQEYTNSGRMMGHVVGDTDTFDFDRPSGDTDPPPLHAVWTGSGFLVTLGPTLLRHAPSGSFLERRSLGDDILESDVAMGRTPFVVLLRDTGVPRLFVRPLDH